ncbi:hypothetical protein EDB83DRAFT_2515288 [Lactarius deliciosus]|nr:hypothetical protein EDB83DRAFT_2515288 [Lactarius deliciosus]
MVHGVKPILPFDLTQATFLVPNLTTPLSTTDLIAIRSRQLQMREDDLARIRDDIVKSRLSAAHSFGRHTAQKEGTTPTFTLGDLVLIRNSVAENTHLRKMKPRYFSPMVVVKKTRNGAYRLAELDGAVSKLRFAAFRLVPYHARSPSVISVTRLLDSEALAALDNPDGLDFFFEECLTGDGQDFDPPGGSLSLAIVLTTFAESSGALFSRPINLVDFALSPSRVLGILPLPSPLSTSPFSPPFSFDFAQPSCARSRNPSSSSLPTFHFLSPSLSTFAFLSPPQSRPNPRV